MPKFIDVDQLRAAFEEMMQRLMAESPQVDNSVEYFCKSDSFNYSAVALLQGDKVVVIAGSTFREDQTPSCPKLVAKQRVALRKEGIIVGNKLVKNCGFDSLSGAASFVCGASTNGYDAWLDVNGNPPKKLG